MKKFIKHSGIRFILAGALNTALTYLLYLLLLQFMSYRISYKVTYVAGIAFGYWINATWVFLSQPGRKSAFIYPIAYVSQYVIGLLLLSVFIETFSIDERLAPLLVIIITVPVMFIMTRAIFSKRGQNV